MADVPPHSPESSIDTFEPAEPSSEEITPTAPWGCLRAERGRLHASCMIMNGPRIREPYCTRPHASNALNRTISNFTFVRPEIFDHDEHNEPYKVGEDRYPDVGVAGRHEWRLRELSKGEPTLIDYEGTFWYQLPETMCAHLHLTAVEVPSSNQDHIEKWKEFLFDRMVKEHAALRQWADKNEITLEEAATRILYNEKTGKGRPMRELTRIMGLPGSDDHDRVFVDRVNNTLRRVAREVYDAIANVQAHAHQAHASGSQAHASGSQAHASGFQAHASGSQAHAHQASGSQAHAHQASGSQAHAHQASGSQAHAHQASGSGIRPSAGPNTPHQQAARPSSRADRPSSRASRDSAARPSPDPKHIPIPLDANGYIDFDAFMDNIKADEVRRGNLPAHREGFSLFGAQPVDHGARHYRKRAPGNAVSERHAGLQAHEVYPHVRR
jgi:hypothetical protein